MIFHITTQTNDRKIQSSHPLMPFEQPTVPYTMTVQPIWKICQLYLQPVTTKKRINQYSGTFVSKLQNAVRCMYCMFLLREDFQFVFYLQSILYQTLKLINLNFQLWPWTIFYKPCHQRRVPPHQGWTNPQLLWLRYYVN